MKATRLVLLLVLCCVGIFAWTGCGEPLDTTTTMEGDTTTTVDGDAATTVSVETTIAAGSGGGSTTTAASGSGGKAATTTTAMWEEALPPGSGSPDTKLLKGTWTWDVDNDVDGAGTKSDLWYQISDELVHCLRPQNGAKIAEVKGLSFDAVDLSYLQGVKYGSAPLYTADVDNPNTLGVGDIIALETNDGLYAKLEIIGFEPFTASDGILYDRYDIRFRYVLYPG